MVPSISVITVYAVVCVFSSMFDIDTSSPTFGQGLGHRKSTILYVFFDSIYEYFDLPKIIFDFGIVLVDQPNKTSQIIFKVKIYISFLVFLPKPFRILARFGLALKRGSPP